MQRGVIRNRNYAGQLRDFSGLRFGNITPTDIDLFIEYHNRGYVIGEFKFKGTELPLGQRLALERACDDMKKDTLAFIASHESAGDIDTASAKVSEFRWRGKWRSGGDSTVRDLVGRFVGWLDLDRE